MDRRALVEEALTRSVIGCFFDVYNILKFGLLESLYSRALELGLLLHFGPDPQFDRVYVPNDPKSGR